jgi:hypothetical protein
MMSTMRFTPLVVLCPTRSGIKTGNSRAKRDPTRLDSNLMYNEQSRVSNFVAKRVQAK